MTKHYCINTSKQFDETLLAVKNSCKIKIQF